MSSRFAPTAADALRAAIREAGGVEVFAIGDVEHGVVTAIQVAARGTEDRVLAILGRPRAGQVVIHDHPSGDLRPSDPDLRLAARYAEDGVGFVIVDVEVTRSNWVVEPWTRSAAAVDPADVDRFFLEQLPAVLPGSEARDAQRTMAHAVARALSDAAPLVVEAGTGTGKSLAYLVPAALWALANDTKVVVATHTRALQAQLLSSDLPLLARAGLQVRTAVLEGRGNYLCRRRLGLAREEEGDDGELAQTLARLEAWSDSSAGSRTDLGETLQGDVWDRVASDADLTLRMRCPHYDVCHYYTARREAAGAHVVVVNHALLLAHLALVHEAGFGVLPAFGRVILDEAHHLEDVATGLTSSSVTALAIRRAVAPLLPRRGPGALARLDAHVRTASEIPTDVVGRVVDAVQDGEAALVALPDVADAVLGEVAGLLDPTTPARRVDGELLGSTDWQDVGIAQLTHLASALGTTLGHLEAVRDALAEHKLPEAQAQPLLDVGRAHRRLTGHLATIQRFLGAGPSDTERVRWIALARRRSRVPTAALHDAPLDVAASLRELLWSPLPGAVATSATLSVAGEFRFWKARHGVDDATELVLPSPFDHFQQAILGLPTDLPDPDAPGYLAATARAIVEAIEASGGGAFVLCTSFRAVDAYAEVLGTAFGGRYPLLVQGTVGRATLLARFRERPDSVLVGTDSFWEGVSVRGWGLRLVILPRLPFRVPSDPLARTRHERMAAAGIDPFRADTLPRAVLKLRQGYGRLLRSRSDRGVVLLLDGRVHHKTYGRVVLGALPPARRVRGPWARVLAETRAFLAAAAPAAAPRPPR